MHGAGCSTDADIFITGNIGDTNRKLGLDYESVKAIKPEHRLLPGHRLRRVGSVRGGAHPRADDGRRSAAVRRRSRSTTTGSSWRPVTGRVAAAASWSARCTPHSAWRAALARARLTGEGCYLDVSCADAVLASQVARRAPDAQPGARRPELGREGGAPADPPSTSTTRPRDGKYILFCAIETKFWEHWCTAVGRDDLLREHRADLVVDFAGGDDALRREIQQDVPHEDAGRNG